MATGAGAAGKVLWDIAGPSTLNPTGDPDLGNTIGKPIIARLNNGDWSAIFGNGYLSQNGCAVLFIVRLSDGNVTKIGTTGTPGTSVCTTGNANLSNGLGPVSLSDVDGNFTTDYVYAGDLQGNLWKFDLHTAALAATPATYVGTPLFTASSNGGIGCVGVYPAASTCQQITTAPVLGPALPGLSGTMVYFGTGRLWATGDTATTSTQSFYGVLDSGSAISGGQGALVQQTITTAGNFRSVSTNAVTSSSHGWYMNLPASGERVVLSPVLADGLVLFATVIPNADPCSGGASSWLMAVSASTNTVGGTQVFMSGATGYDGLKSTYGSLEGLTVVSDTSNNRDVTVISGSTGVGVQTIKTKRAKGRISWHDLGL